MINLLWDNIFKNEERAQDLAHVLSQNRLFHNLNRSEIKIVEDLVHERHYRAGESIFRQGDIGIGMYIVVKGSVDISVLDSEEPNSPDQYKEILISKLKKGDFFGEISLVEENGKRTAHAVAAEDSILIGFFKPDMNVIIENYPSVGIKIAMNLAEVIGRRLKSTTEKISQLRREIKILTELQKANENTGSTHKA
jgi:CRP-like cAMP-binding protein